MKVILHQTYSGQVTKVDQDACTVKIQGIEPAVHTYMKSELGGQLPEIGAEVMAIITIVSTSNPNPPIRKKLNLR